MVEIIGLFAIGLAFIIGVPVDNIHHSQTIPEYYRRGEEDSGKRHIGEFIRLSVHDNRIHSNHYLDYNTNMIFINLWDLSD